VARRIAAILLILTFAALGSGLFAGLHRHAHALADASHHAAEHTDHRHDQDNYHDDGDDHDSSCAQCIGLHCGIFFSNTVTLLSCLGLLSVGFVFLPASPALRRVHSPIDSRGPPHI
jgi:hypothetical protein